MENGEYGVTHYDVIFESGVKEYVPVEDLQILKEVHHSGTHHFGPDAVKKFPPKKKKEKKEEVEIDEMEFEAGRCIIKIQVMVRCFLKLLNDKRINGGRVW